MFDHGFRNHKPKRLWWYIDHNFGHPQNNFGDNHNFDYPGNNFVDFHNFDHNFVDFFRCYAVTQTSLLLQRRQLPLEVIILIIMITKVVMVITMITMVVMMITMMVMVVIKEDCRNNTDPGNLGRWSTLGGKCWRLQSSLWQQVANH